MLYGIECQIVKRQHIYKMNVAEMGMLSWISGNTRKDGIQNEGIRLKIRMAPIDEKMRESRLTQFDYMQRREINAPVRKSELIQKKKKRGRGRPKITIVEVVKNDMSIKEVRKSEILDRIEWWKRIHKADFDQSVEDLQPTPKF